MDLVARELISVVCACYSKPYLTSERGRDTVSCWKRSFLLSSIFTLFVLFTADDPSIWPLLFGESTMSEFAPLGTFFKILAVIFLTPSFKLLFLFYLCWFLAILLTFILLLSSGTVIEWTICVTDFVFTLGLETIEVESGLAFQAAREPWPDSWSRIFLSKSLPATDSTSIISGVPLTFNWSSC